MRDTSHPPLIGTLQSTYPLLRAWLGEDQFLRAATWHLELNAPHAWMLDACADDFGLTLRELFPEQPDLQELAWIERALDNSYLADDLGPIAPASLAGINWNTVHLRLTPTLQITHATTNAADIWSAMEAGRHQPKGRLLASPKGLLVWRRRYLSCLRTIEPLELEAISCVQAFGSFSNLCVMLSGHLGEREGVSRAAALLASWLGDELVTGVHHPHQLN